MDLNATLFFVTVANAGSFTEASRRLRVSKSTISEKVAELETRLGVTLKMRTTRRLKLTGRERLSCARLRPPLTVFGSRKRKLQNQRIRRPERLELQRQGIQSVM
jgi:DNA-binding transcriptional LysR family regulator